MNTVVQLVALVALVQTGDASSRVELQAETWFNPPSIRIPEDRTYVLLFFSTLQEREVKPWVEQLNKIARHKDVVVVGLSPESKERVSKFVDEQKIKFTVGSKSAAYKRFKMKCFPQVVVIPPQKCDKAISPEVLDLEHFDRRFPAPRGAEPLTSGAFDDDSPVDLLRQHAREDSDRGESLRALGLLRKKLSTEEFLDFCDQLLAQEENVFRRGNVQFQRRLADPSIPENEKEPLLAPASQAMHMCRENPDDPQWAPVRDYVDRVTERTAEELFQDYLDHAGDNPADLMIRRASADHLGSTSDKPRARELLMQMLPMEQDAVIRMSMVFGFTESCQPGDFDVADFLEQQLQTEKNYRSVRPAMEYVIRYLRTGEE